MVPLFNVVGMSLAVWGFSVSLDTISRLVRTPGILLWVLGLMFGYLLIFLVPEAIIATRLGISVREYARWVVLAMCVHYYCIFRIIMAQVTMAFGAKVEFIVTDKTWRFIPFNQIVRNMMPTVVLGLFLLAGIILRNPLSFLFNSPWLLILWFSPFILYLCHKRSDAQ